MAKEKMKEKIEKVIEHIEAAMNGIYEIGETFNFKDNLFETELWDSLDFAKTYLNDKYIVPENKRNKNIKFF